MLGNIPPRKWHVSGDDSHSCSDPGFFSDLERDFEVVILNHGSSVEDIMVYYYDTVCRQYF